VKNERERPRAFVCHPIATFKMILCRRALPKYDRLPSKRYHPRISDQLLIEEKRRAMRSFARVRNRCDIAIDRTMTLARITA